LHLAGILFPHINDDTRLKSHQKRNVCFATGPIPVGNDNCTYYSLHKGTLILFMLAVVGKIGYINQTTVKMNLRNARK